MFDEIYDLFFFVGGGARVEDYPQTIPAPETLYDPAIILRAEGKIADKVDIILKAVSDFQPMATDTKGALKKADRSYVMNDVGSIWRELWDVEDGGTGGNDERIQTLVTQMVSYCKTRYSMMVSGGDRMSKINGDLFRSVAQEVGEVRWITKRTLYVTTDSRTRQQYMAINPMFVLRAVIETFLKQVHNRQVSDDAAGLEIVAKQVVCYLFLHEFSHIAYGHLNGLQAHEAIFGMKLSNYSFDSYINRNIENDEKWVTPDGGISTANYVVIEAVENGGKFQICLTAFLTDQDLFPAIERNRQLKHLPGSFVGVVPICYENLDVPSLRWNVKKNIIKLMNEKQVFTPEEIEELKKKFKDKAPAPKPKPKPKAPEPKPQQQPSKAPETPKPKDATNELTQIEREKLSIYLHKLGHSDDDIKAITGLGILPVWVDDASAKPLLQPSITDTAVANDIKKVSRARKKKDSDLVVTDITEPITEPPPMVQPVIRPIAQPEPEPEPMVQPVEAPKAPKLKKEDALFKLFDRILVSPSGQTGYISSDVPVNGLYKITVGPKSGYIDPARLTILPRTYNTGDRVMIMSSGLSGVVIKVKPGAQDTLYIKVVKNGKNFQYYAGETEVQKLA